MNTRILALVATCLFANQGFSNTIVAPGALATVDGNGSNAFPFVGASSASGAGGLRYQQVFASSQFASLTSPASISAITFRPEAGEAPGTVSYLNFILRLSTTSAQPDALSTTFANNVGADNTLVYSGQITLSTSVSGSTGKGSPAAFDINIPFQTGFLYNPGQGNLLIDLFLTGPSAGSGTGILIDTQNTTGDAISRLIAVSGVDNISSGVGRASTEGAPVQFTYTVPEPSTSALCSGLAVLLGIRLWRRGSTRQTELL